jgi:hypothetical protein
MYSNSFQYWVVLSFAKKEPLGIGWVYETLTSGSQSQFSKNNQRTYPEQLISTVLFYFFSFEAQHQT